MHHVTHISGLWLGMMLLVIAGCAADSPKEQTSAAIVKGENGDISPALLTAHRCATDKSFNIAAGDELNMNRNLKPLRKQPLQQWLKISAVIVTVTPTHLPDGGFAFV